MYGNLSLLRDKKIISLATVISYGSRILNKQRIRRVELRKSKGLLLTRVIIIHTATCRRLVINASFRSRWREVINASIRSRWREVINASFRSRWREVINASFRSRWRDGLLGSYQRIVHLESERSARRWAEARLVTRHHAIHLASINTASYLVSYLLSYLRPLQHLPLKLKSLWFELNKKYLF